MLCYIETAAESPHTSAGNDEEVASVSDGAGDTGSAGVPISPNNDDSNVESNNNSVTASGDNEG